ncbi:MAG: glycine cleavage system aminomethyltransferase GcvT [Vulcanimicrobiaceae bacterium]
MSAARTVLYDDHVALGARLTPFGGFDMPVSYAGILREHAAVRHRAGLFDLSHMAQYELRGAGVGAWADALTVNDVASMRPGQARYNIFTNDVGGCRDDVLFYRIDGDRFLLVINAANATKMWPYLAACARERPDVTIVDRRAHALIAVQGPRACEILAPLCDVDVSVMKYYACIEGRVDGADALVARTGYTGEDGFEVFVGGDSAPALWRTLLQRGEPLGLEPAGLGARDMLRLEAGMPLYGHELDETISPVAGGQRWAVKTRKPAFPGRDEIVAQIAGDAYDRIVGLVLDGPVPARADYHVRAAGERIGAVRSGTLAPSVGNKNIATALVRKDASAVGTVLEVEIRGALHRATVVPLPFYKRPT